jgi:serine/threonine-protein kinase HipA
LRLPDGWRLAPAYDIVPAPMVAQEYRPLALTVGHHGRAASLYNLVSQAERFGLTVPEARAVFDRVVEVVRGWRDVYRAAGVTDRDCEIMAPAFLPESLFQETPPERPD